MVFPWCLFRKHVTPTAMTINTTSLLAEQIWEVHRGAPESANSKDHPPSSLLCANKFPYILS